jgi:hypothetical protein
MPETKSEFNRPATDQVAGLDAEIIRQKPFKPQRIDLTPEEPVNIGYVGGVDVRTTEE